MVNKHKTKKNEIILVSVCRHITISIYMIMLEHYHSDNHTSAYDMDYIRKCYKSY